MLTEIFWINRIYDEYDSNEVIEQGSCIYSKCICDETVNAMKNEDVVKYPITISCNSRQITINESTQISFKWNFPLIEQNNEFVVEIIIKEFN